MCPKNLTIGIAIIIRYCISQEEVIVDTNLIPLAVHENNGLVKQMGGQAKT